jgi:hypothetical protein
VSHHSTNFVKHIKSETELSDLSHWQTHLVLESKWWSGARQNVGGREKERAITTVDCKSASGESPMPWIYQRLNHASDKIFTDHSCTLFCWDSSIHSALPSPHELPLLEVTLFRGCVNFLERFYLQIKLDDIDSVLRLRASYNLGLL